MPVTEMQIRLADPAEAESRRLVDAMCDEIDATYADREGSIHSVTASPAEMSPPRGAFVILEVEGRSVGCGGLKEIGPGVCEIKRMYLEPAVRGRGLSGEILRALEDRARELGYSVARLDTAERQLAAQRLYSGAGYRGIPDYNGNDLARYWYEKEL